MEFRLRFLAILVFVLSLILLMEDMRWISIPGYSRTLNGHGQKAGHISILHNHVQIKTQNSLLWSRAQTNDDVRLYDAILTGESSEAKLQLNNDSIITLSENTLVMIEPSHDQNNNTIRIKFAKGHFNGKNLTKDMQIDFREIEVKIIDKSEIQINSNSNETLSLTLNSGSAEIKTQENTLSLKANENLTIDGKKSSIHRLSDKLVWDNDFQRVYTNSETQKVNLQWNGQVEWLVHNYKNQTQNILAEKNSLQLELPIGTHFFKLKDKENVSSLKTVQVVKIPPLHLYFPLPRDRVGLNEPISFHWRAFPQAVKYKIEISDSVEFKNIIHSNVLSENHHKYSFREVGKFHWRVKGFDADDFEMPAAYSNAIVSIVDPLDAPGIRAPSNMKEEAWLHKKWWYVLLRLLINSASASQPEIRFEWDKVSHADNYTIEIDDDPYFQSPEVETTIKNSRYQWTLPQRGVYYWRVAADQKNGRLGRFSNVQRVDLSKLRTGSRKINTYDVYVYTSEPTPETETLLPPEKVEAPAKEEEKVEAHSLQNHDWRASYGLGYYYAKISSSDIDSVQMSGFDGFNLYLETNRKSYTNYFRITSQLQINQWKPKSTKDTPFQKNVSTTEWSITAHISDSQRSFWLGFLVEQNYEPARKSLESFDIQNKLLLGPSVAWHTQLTQETINEIEAALLVGEKEWGTRIGNKLIKKFRVSHDLQTFAGFHLDAHLRSKPNSFLNQQYRSLLLLGFDW